MNPSNLSPNIRPRVKKLQYSPTLAINQQVQSLRQDGVQILHMGFGQSPFPVHTLIQFALKASVDRNSYLPSAGLPILRRLAQEYLAKAFGFDGQGYEVVICAHLEMWFGLTLAKT